MKHIAADRKWTIPDLLALRDPIDEKCKGCKKIELVDEKELCTAYIEPSIKWRLGDCLLATHRIIEVSEKPKKYKPGKYGKKRRNR